MKTPQPLILKDPIDPHRWLLSAKRSGRHAVVILERLGEVVSASEADAVGHLFDRHLTLLEQRII